MKNQKVIVLDFGGQYNQLIARRVRECNVYCEVLPYTTPIEKLKAENPIGIIFTGGPGSVYLENAPHYDPAIFEMGVPILGICYGCQLMAHTLGGQVTEAQDDSAREYGKTLTYYDTSCKLFKDLPAEGISWMSHGDYMAKVPEGFKLTAHSDACPNVAIADEARGFYGVQYHPEVNHTENGIKMIRNFLYEVCGATGDWTMGDYLKTAVNQIREKVGDGKVLLALSGGVDSSVAAALLAKAVGPQLTCIFVDHGLLRKNEGDEVASIFGNMDINFVRVNAEERFLNKLAGVSEPERKRKIIGEEFIRVFEDEAKRSARSTIWYRVPSTLMSLNRVPVTLLSSRATTTLAVSLTMSTLKRLSNRSVCCLKMKSVSWAASCSSLNIWSCASPSPAPDLQSVLSVKSPRKNWTSCGMPTISSVMRSPKLAWSIRSTSILLS